MNTRTILDCGGKRSATPLSLVNRLRQALPPKRRRRGALPAHSTTWRLGLLCFCFLLSAFCFRAWGQYSLDWSTIDGGGGTSTGGVYSVTGTIGQPDAGAMSGGNFTLTGGFWSVIAAVQTPGAPFLSIVPATPGWARVSWAPTTGSGFVLQVSPALTPPVWANAPSGATNPVIIPATLPARFYRLIKP
jgi:hypothetical protein